MEARKIKVLIIDDSAVIRQLLTQIFNSTNDIEVVDTALDPLFAEQKIQKHQPDVITLDVEMPRMDGITFLQKLMQENPRPVIMLSGLTQQGGDLSLRALELGAVDVVGKPTQNVVYSLTQMADELIRKVRAAAQIKIKSRRADTSLPSGSQHQFQFAPVNKIIAIGASTGGTEAIKKIASVLPPETPGILVVQHIAPTFSRAFANNLQSVAKMDVRIAQTGDRIMPGVILVAPGDQHMTIRRDGTWFAVEFQSGQLVNSVSCSADVLFGSLASTVGNKAIGVILTGMGSDGADGLLKMKEAGAFTIAQDENSSLVFGMPKKAIERGAVCSVVHLDQIAGQIMLNLAK